MPADQSQPASELVRILAEGGLTVATAEATTGGLAGHLIVAVPGSSAVFRAGAAPYSNQAKVAIGVSADLLKQYGAVSQEAAEALAVAAKEWAGADIGIAETGIAGPAGGNAERPVGLFWIAVARGNAVIARRYEFGTGRTANHQSAADAAIRLAIEVARG